MIQNRLSLARLQKEIRDIETTPIDNILVAVDPEDNHQIHFCLFGMEEPYKNGFYHGFLELPENYPFSAPKLKFFTESNRFETGKYICTTFTSYHQEQWSASWTLRTILLASQSFFLSHEVGFGSIQKKNPKLTKQLAEKSLNQNLGNPVFVEYFAKKLALSGVKHYKLLNVLPPRKDKQSPVNLTHIESQPAKEKQVQLFSIPKPQEMLLQPELGRSDSQQISNVLEERQRVEPNHTNKIITLLYMLMIAAVVVLCWYKL